MVHAIENIASQKVYCKLLSLNVLQHYSLITFHSSLPKHICFTLQKISFRVMKDGLLEGKRRSFATQNIYVSGMRDKR